MFTDQIVNSTAYEVSRLSPQRRVCSRTSLFGENVGREDPEKLRRGCCFSVDLIERSDCASHSTGTIIPIACALVHCPARLCRVFAIEALEFAGVRPSSSFFPPVHRLHRCRKLSLNEFPLAYIDSTFPLVLALKLNVHELPARRRQAYQRQSICDSTPSLTPTKPHSARGPKS